MFAPIGGFIGKLSDKPFHTTVAVATSVPFFGAFEFMVHELLAGLGLPGLADALLDALLVGLCFAFAVWVLLVGNRERRLRVRHELERIAELNHEVRNALQVIVHSHFDTDPQRRDMILESATRIDAVLKRLFPVVGG